MQTPTPPAKREPIDPSVGNAMETLTIDEIVAFLIEKTRSTNCPTCHANDWTVLGPQDVGLTLIPVKPPGVAPDKAYERPEGIPAILACCSNCGYIRQHAGLVIGKWKRDREQKK